MTAAELLKPRRIVELDYPNSPFKIGDILTLCPHGYKSSGGIIVIKRDVEPYPHIFKPLKWWERRKVEDMPKKVKCIIEGASNEGCVYDVEKIDLENELIYINKKHGLLFCFEPID